MDYFNRLHITYHISLSGVGMGGREYYEESMGVTSSEFKEQKLFSESEL